MKRSLLVLLVLFLSFAVLAGCKPQAAEPKSNTPAYTSEEANRNNANLPKPTDAAKKEKNEPAGIAYPVEVTDSKGNVFTLQNEPQRIVSLGVNITEIVFALGKGDNLVGRTAFCDYPQEVSSVTVVGDFMEWNFETILSLEPDIVFSTSLNTAENEKKLIDLGVPVFFITSTESFESVYETIRIVGSVLNAGEKAENIIEDMKKTVSTVESAVKGLERPSVYYVVGYGEYGDYTATGETFIASMIDMAGGDNIAANLTGWVYSLEKLIENDPYIILCSEETKNVFKGANGYKELTAVVEDRIYAIDDNLIMRQGPRLAEGLLEMAKILHPGTSLK